MFKDMFLKEGCHISRNMEEFQWVKDQECKAKLANRELGWYYSRATGTGSLEQKGKETSATTRKKPLPNPLVIYTSAKKKKKRPH